MGSPEGGHPDLFRFPRFLLICSVFFRFVPICVACFREYPDLFRFAPISSDLFRFVFRTNQGNPFLPTPIATPRTRKEPYKKNFEMMFRQEGWREEQDGLEEERERAGIDISWRVVASPGIILHIKFYLTPNRNRQQSSPITKARLTPHSCRNIFCNVLIPRLCRVDLG